MTDKEYHAISEQTLKRVRDAFEDEDPDEVEAETIPGIVTLLFGDGKRFILNRQPAVHQLWLAAGASAWHFNYDADAQAWVSDRSEGELFAILARVVGERLGRAVIL